VEIDVEHRFWEGHKMWQNVEDNPSMFISDMSPQLKYTRSPASAGIANRPLVFLGIFLIFGRLSIY